MDAELTNLYRLQPIEKYSVSNFMALRVPSLSSLRPAGRKAPIGCNRTGIGCNLTAYCDCVSKVVALIG